jgi:hypothetical protein
METWVAVGQLVIPILTAVIAVMGGVWGFRLQKKQTEAELRIEILRNSYADYFASVSDLIFEMPAVEGSDSRRTILHAHLKTSSKLGLVAPRDVYRSILELDRSLTDYNLSTLERDDKMGDPKKLENIVKLRGALMDRVRSEIGFPDAPK